jgi:HSP20 family protein
MNCSVTKYETRPSRSTVGIMPLGRLIDSFFNEALQASATGHTSGTQTYDGMLAVDVSEDAGNLVVRANLPGFTKDQIDIEVHDGVLSITARRNEETATPEGERFYRRERRVQSVARQIALPFEVLDEQARAELADGVLTLRLPKSPKETPRKVSIT